MRLTCLVGLALAATVVSVSADLAGSSVELVEPSTPIDPGEVYTFVFRVARDWSDDESVVGVAILFPGGFVPDMATMGYAEIVPGRPMFDTMVYGVVAAWADNTEDGGIHMGEAADVWVDVTVNEAFDPGITIQLDWSLTGGSGGSNSGTCDISTPVESRSWSGIKALYLDG